MSPHFVPVRLTDEQVHFYQEQGYLNVGRVLTNDGIARMSQEVMAAWHSEKTGFDEKKTWLQNSLLPNIHHRSNLAREFYFRGPLVDVAQRLIGPNIKAASSQLTFKMAGNITPFAWHQDNNYGHLEPYNTLTTLTALDDADVENGCLWIVPGSHRQGQIEVEAQSAEERKTGSRSVEVAVDETHAVPLPMKAGEAVVFHCWMLHKSEANTSPRDRRILFLRYADADAVEVHNGGVPRLGRLLRGQTKFAEVVSYEAGLGGD